MKNPISICVRPDSASCTLPDNRRGFIVAMGVKRSSHLIPAALLVLLAARAPAQINPSQSSLRDNELTEIVVTATRREEILSRVPISIVAITPEQIDEKGIKDFADIARYVPGVTMDTDLTNSITIRGIGSSGGAGTTGIYIDDTPIQMKQVDFDPDEALPKTFDIERIEVLRGPQGTTFGSGSEGGTVRYLFKQPSLTESSSYSRNEVSYTQGGSPSYETGYAAGGPISEGNLGFRASAWYRRDGGWIDRVDPYAPDHLVSEKNANFDRTLQLRLALTWAPTSNVTVTPSVLYQNRYRNDVSIWWPALSDPGRDEYRSGNPGQTRQPDEFSLSALKIEANLSAVRLISNSAYYRRRDQTGIDYTEQAILPLLQSLVWPNSTPYVPLHGPACPTFNSCYPMIDQNGLHLPASVRQYATGEIPITNAQDNLTQEIRLQSIDPAARLTWTAGAFFAVSRLHVINEQFFPHMDQLWKGLFGTTYAAAFGTPRNPDGSTKMIDGAADLKFEETDHERQLAGFGEAVIGLTDRIKLTAGLRYSKVDHAVSNSAGRLTGTSTSTGSSTEKPLTERLGLAFQMNPDNMFYATYSTGYRSGGVNSPLTGSCLQDPQAPFVPSGYKSDKLKSYEVGSKNIFDKRVRIAASAFYIKWTDIAEGVLMQCQARYTANLGEATIKGADLQAEIILTKSVSLEVTAAYTNAAFSKTLFTSGPDVPLVRNGDSIIGLSNQPAPPVSVAVGGVYDFNLFDRKYFARFDYEYHSKDHRLNAPEDPGTVQYDPYLFTPPASSFLSLRSGTTFGAWKVSAFVDNVLDKHTIFNYDHSFQDFNAPVPPAPMFRYNTFRPRTIGLTFTIRM
jgi:outer membrane receptor protein involved in Fe transport